MAALGLLLGVTAAPAGAHDALESTVPADGAVLASPPTEIVLTFGADQLPMGTAVAVTGPDGADHAEGEPRVDGDVVTQTVGPGAPAGDYTVQWRSVSGDGHPISGELGFSVVGDADGADDPTAAPDPRTDPAQPAPGAGAAPGAQEDPAPAPTASPEATAGADAPAEAAPPATGAEGPDASGGQAPGGARPWLVPGAVVIALAVAGVAVARRRGAQH